MLESSGEMTPPLRNAFARCAEETPINTACFDKPPKQGQEALISDTFADAFQQQAVMDCLKVAGQVALYHPATCRSLFITFLQLQFDRSYRMVNTPGGPKTIRSSMEITLPYRLHGHQHRPLNHSIPQAWDT